MLVIEISCSMNHQLRPVSTSLPICNIRGSSGVFQSSTLDFFTHRHHRSYVHKNL